MANEVEPHDPGEGPRRKTYEPPADDAVFTGSLPIIGDDAEDSPVVLEQRLGYPAPPTRSSMSELAILQKFREPGAGSTTEMIAELERQVLLKEEEEEEFSSWAAIMRNLKGEDAEPIISRERIIFDGGDPGPLEQVVSTIETLDEHEDEADERPTEGDSAESLVHDLLEEEDSIEEAGYEDDDSSLEQELDDVGSEAEEEETFREQLQVTTSTHTTSPDGGGQAPWSLVLSWWGLAIPLVAVSAGSFLAFSGLGMAESLVTTLVVAIVVGIIAGVFGHQRYRRDLAPDRLMTLTFGRWGAILPGVLMGLAQAALLAFLLWWTSDSLASIVVGAGLWPYAEWIAVSGGAGLALAVIGALALLPSRVLQVALFVSFGASLVGLGSLLVVGIPVVVPEVSWTWNASWMSVVSAGSVLLSCGLLALVHTPLDVAGLSKTSRSAAGGVLGAVGLMIPFGAMVLFTVWMAESSALVSVGLAGNPIGTLTEGQPAFYPVFAIAGIVAPLLVAASVLTRAAAVNLKVLGIPGPVSVHRATALILSTGTVTALLLLEIDPLRFVVDGALTAGVVAAAVSGVMAKEWAVLGSKDIIRETQVRATSVIALVVALSVGFGFLTSEVWWLSWQGYLLPVAELAGLIDLSPAALGVLASFVVAGVISGFGALAQLGIQRKFEDADVAS